MQDLFGGGAAARNRVVLDGTFAHFREHVRALVAADVPAEDVEYVVAAPSALRADEGGALFETREQPTPAPDPGGATLSLPRAAVARIETASHHRSDAVWCTLHRVVARIAGGERDLLDDSLDPDVVALTRFEKAIRRDAHKMHAFVRFRRLEDDDARGGERFVAWYQPSHRIVGREARFFRERFPSMDWSILTPDGCAHWNGARVVLTPGVDRDAAPKDDDWEALWCDYYASIFNPARVKLDAMRAEMPKKFWHTLPETQQMESLLADVPRRLEEMRRNSRRMADSAAAFVPGGADLSALREALASCEGCELCTNGTRAVAGEGRANARIALLGEQPGDVEERSGRPFVGPAGEELGEALRAAGLTREDLYVTNAVKHFRHDLRGKRRIHKRPTVEHVSRCQPWVDAELAAVEPEALVCLGVTAGRAVFGPTHRAPDPNAAPTPRSSRYAPRTFTTFHPAAILRAPDEARRERLRSHLLATLRRASQDRGAPVR
ncbi:MAG: UdgX family uracil-DNA binding protein [Planctomycetota bacterium]